MGISLRWAAALLLGGWVAGFVFAPPAAAVVSDSPAIADIRAAITAKGTATVIVEMALDEDSSTGLERPQAAAEDAPLTKERVQSMVSRQQERVANAASPLRSELAAAGITMEQEFENLPMFVTTVDAAKLERLMVHPKIKAITLNKAHRPQELPPEMMVLGSREVFPVAVSATAAEPPTAAAEKAARAADLGTAQSALTTATYIKADLVWARGFRGQGQAVAVLDNGIERTHDMFSDKIVGEACYSPHFNSTEQSLCPNDLSSVVATGAASNCPAIASACAHGMHVAGIATGNDVIGPTQWQGVAPDAKVVPIQVFTIFNSTSDCDTVTPPCLLTYSSAQLSALNYVISRVTSLNIAAVNLSVGGDPVSGACDNDELKPAIDTLRTMGVLTVIAAGNDGQLGKIANPACITTAIAVSSVIITLPDSDVNQSSRVDLLAPGSLVLSAGPNNTYVNRSGTSMATPHVAGAIALLKSAKPAATATEIENALKTGGIASSLSNWTWTTPRVDVNAALDKLQTGTTAAGPTGTAVIGIYNSLSTTGQSNLRFYNAGQGAGTVTVGIYNEVTGAKLGTWTKSIPGLASLQFAAATIENEATPVIKPSAAVPSYAFYVDAPFTGFVQHVLWNQVGGSLTNITGCAGGMSSDGLNFGNTHTSLIKNYTSYLLIHNTGTAAAKPTFTIRDARNGAQAGTFSTSQDVPPQGSVLMNVSNVLESINQTPQTGEFHLNLVMSAGFTGFAQHLVDNETAHVITNMTAKCDM